MRRLGLAMLALALGALAGCSTRQLAVDQLSDALAKGGSAFSSDDDPHLVRAAAPFGLKLVESLLAENPRHRSLLLAAARGFTQYAYAFVQQEAEEAEALDLARSARLEKRARRMYRRARDYGIRGLASAGANDVPLLYWTGVAWAAWIALSKSDPEALAQLPAMEALMQRALELDPAFERGAIHTFLIGYEMSRPGAAGDPAGRAREHFARAMALSAGGAAAPLVALAESVCVPQQRRREFEALLEQALRLDADTTGPDRLATLVAQRRARWLLSRAERLFTDSR